MRLTIRPRPDGPPADLGHPLLPGSKSHTQRAMILAGLLPGEWWLPGAADGQDAQVLGAALVALGADVAWRRDGVAVTGRLGRCRVPPELDLVENGTGARGLLMALAMVGERFRLDGRDGLRQRPFDAALAALRMAGVKVTGSRLPLGVDARGARFADPILVDGRVTTQAATGCMLGAGLLATLEGRGIGPRMQRALGLGRRRPERNVQVVAPSAPGYLEVTAAMLRAFGHDVEGESHGEDHVFRIAPRRRQVGEVAIPVDPSTRTFPLVLAAMHGRAAGTLPGAAQDPHPEWAVDRDVAAVLAGPVGSKAVELTGLAARPDAVPALAVLAATRPHPVAIRGVPALRHKESDRIAALAAGLSALGVAVEEFPEGLLVAGPLDPGPPDAAPLELPCPPDHRMVMALALLGTVRRGGVVVPHATAVGKSWPGFHDWLERIAEVRVTAR